MYLEIRRHNAVCVCCFSLYIMQLSHSAVWDHRSPPCEKVDAGGGTRWGTRWGRFPTVEHAQGTPPSIHARQEFWTCSKLWPCADGRRQTVRAWYEDGIRTANPLPARYMHVRGALVDVDPLSDVCERVHDAWITYFGVAIHISVRQYIFRSGNTYFRATIHISEQQYIFQRRRYAHGEDTVRTRWERQARTVWGRRPRYQAGQDPV